MYMLDTFLDEAMAKMELEFPNKAYRNSAKNVLLYNPNVKTMDQLMNGLRLILAIPEDEIRTARLIDLAKNHGMRHIVDGLFSDLGINLDEEPPIKIGIDF